MAKRVRDIAEELHISKQAVYQRMNTIKDFKSKYAQKVGNHIVINDEGVKELNSELNQNNKDINQLIDETNGIIFKELKTKNEQLRAKDKQIASLQKALDQEQQLHLNADNRISNLEKEIKQIDNNSESSFTDSIDESSVKSKNNAKREKFWHKWFK